jgi:Mn2+/Fe2+ NRAMP family transporter
MTNNEKLPLGTEPLGDIRPLEIPSQRADQVKQGIILRVRGRYIQLRRLHSPPRGLLFWLSILGPGLVAGATSNEAGSIAAYSQAGARYGYDLLWVFVWITVSLAVIQEMSARLGAATGRGLLALIRFQYGIGWAPIASLAVLAANFGLVLGEFVGISSAMRLFNVSPFISVGLAAGLICFFVLGGGYNRAEKIFMVMAAVFLTYPVAAILAHPNAGQVLHGLAVPTIRSDPAYIALLIGLIGTTLSPYQQVFQQSAVVEKGVPRGDYGPERLDTYVGMIFSNLVTIFIIIAAAATLHAAGQTNINTAADAAKSLQPIAGPSAEILFTVGLVGASLMAAAIIPISTAFAFTEAFGFVSGIDLSLRRAPVFYSLFLGQVILAAILALIPTVPAFQLLVGVQVLNGFLLPVVLVFILLLSNNRRVMGRLVNSRVVNIIGWATLALTVSAVLFGLIQRILGK